MAAGGIRSRHGRPGGLRAGTGRPATKKDSGHHGLIDRIPGSGIVGRGLTDLKDAALNMPAGVYELGKAGAGDVRDLVKHGDVTPERLGRIGKGVAIATAQDVRHPLRHPGYLALDLLGFASMGAGTAARGGAALGAIGKGAKAGEVARILARGAKPGPRTFRVGDLEVQATHSKSALTRGAQKLSDKRLHAAAAKRPSGRAAERLTKKAGKALQANLRAGENIAKGDAQALIALGRKLKPSEQMALRVVAEEAPVEGRIAMHQARIEATKGLERTRHKKRVKLLGAASKHLTVKDGKPVFVEKAHKLRKVYERMAQVAGSREQLLKSLDLLTDESVKGRKAKAAAVAVGKPIEEAAPVSEQAVRVPDVPTRASRTVTSGQVSRIGGQGVIGKQRLPGSVTHEFTGGLRRKAHERLDTTRLVGESNLEAQRLGTLKDLHENLRKAASPTPRFEGDIAIRLDKIKSNERLPLEARKYLDDPEEYARQHPAEAQGAFERVRSSLFMDTKHLSGEARAEFERLHAEGKIGWVPRKLLGDLAKQQAPLEATTGRVPVQIVDAINNASRVAIFYAKPAYAVPNVLGNAALNIIQQGFAFPGNLRRASMLHWKLGPELTARIDSVMGEGFAQAIQGQTGIGHAVVEKAANFWSRGVDKPFRRSSFLHEARSAGHKNPRDIERLLTDPAMHDELVEISKRANREIIDYANLSHRERQIIRRIVFVYPWIKGSTTYAGHMVAEHPVKASALAQLARQGQARSEAELGAVPSYLEGLIPLGGNRVSNPASAALLQSPAQVGSALAGATRGNVSGFGELADFPTPAVSLLLAMIARKNFRTQHEYPRSASIADIAKDVLVKGLPQYRLYEGLTGKSQAKLFPTSPRSALEQYIVGGIAPRKVNRSRLRALARQEQHELQR